MRRAAVETASAEADAADQSNFDGKQSNLDVRGHPDRHHGRTASRSADSVHRDAPAPNGAHPTHHTTA